MSIVANRSSLKHFHEALARSRRQNLTYLCALTQLMLHRWVYSVRGIGDNNKTNYVIEIPLKYNLKSKSFFVWKQVLFSYFHINNWINIINLSNIGIVYLHYWHIQINQMDVLISKSLATHAVHQNMKNSRLPAKVTQHLWERNKDICIGRCNIDVFSRRCIPSSYLNVAKLYESTPNWLFFDPTTLCP